VISRPQPLLVDPRSLGRRQAAGYTLVELVIVLLLLGIVAGLAAPSVAGYLRRTSMQVVLDALTRDIYYARMVAARAGKRVEMRFTHAPELCVSGYRIVVIAEPEVAAKEVDFASLAPGICLRKNGPAVVSFSSRGRPNWNYSFWLRHGQLVDSITLNQLGRVYRWH
jgi:prepilin-type N-terminal cleavage/methylation domain-containing protein